MNRRNGSQKSFLKQQLWVLDHLFDRLFVNVGVAFLDSNAKMVLEVFFILGVSSAGMEVVLELTLQLVVDDQFFGPALHNSEIY